MKKGLILFVLFFLVVALFGATYEVKSGDTLESIAATTGVSVDQLAEANDIEYPYVIWVGLKLELVMPATVIATQFQAKAEVDDESSNFLLPNSLAVVEEETSSIFHWDRTPAVGIGIGQFWNETAEGYYRYSNAEWCPINWYSNTSLIFLGLRAEINDDFCQNNESWSQTALGYRVGPVFKLVRSGPGFLNPLILRGYYGFRHAEAQDNNWTKVQEDQTWGIRGELGIYKKPMIYQQEDYWLDSSSLVLEYTGLVEADAVGGNNGQNLALDPYSPKKWEGSLEQSLYMWRDGKGSINLNLGYRHLDGEDDPGKDRIFSGINFQLGWAKVQYEFELENSNKITNKLEAVVSF